VSSLQLPLRSPITATEWLRFFQELLERTGGEDSSSVDEIVFRAAGVSQATGETKRLKAQLSAAPFAVSAPSQSPKIRRHSSELAELHFLRGW